jgi:hypothetical protein
MGILTIVTFYSLGVAFLGGDRSCDAAADIPFYNSRTTRKQSRILLHLLSKKGGVQSSTPTRTTVTTTIPTDRWNVFRLSRGGGDETGKDSNDDVSTVSSTTDVSSTNGTLEQVEKDDKMRSTSSASTDDINSGTFEILNEATVYSGWRTILQRTVRMRNGKVGTFDLVGVKTGGAAVLVFPWDTNTKTVTLIREYMPASNRIMYGLAAGLVEAKHHHDDDINIDHDLPVSYDPELIAARYELEEECHLKDGRWIPFCNVPTAMDKYSTTVIHGYLVLDPIKEHNPRPLDDEEDIEIVSGITIPQVLQLIENGEINLVSGWGCLLAIQKLRELGEYDK